MIRCKTCNFTNSRLSGSAATPGKMGFCEGCNKYLGGRYCQGEGCGFVNSLTARACRSCGRGEEFLSEGTAYASLGFVAPLILVGLAAIAGAGLWFSGVIPSGLRSASFGLEMAGMIVMSIVKLSPFLIAIYIAMPAGGKKFVKDVIKGCSAGILGLGMLLLRLARRK